MPTINQLTTLIFDWGDTIMRDFDQPGPMCDWENVEWIPGAENALKTLSAKYYCVIATSADHSGADEMIAALKRVGAERYFKHFFSSMDLGYKKPDPRFFSAIVLKLGLQPLNCAMIGNLYEKDIVGAKAAGLTTIFFNENFLPGDFPKADFMIHNMFTLPIVLSL